MATFNQEGQKVGIQYNIGYKENLPTDAEYYSTGELKKYWKTEYYKGEYYWFQWSKMLTKWISMWPVDFCAPKRLEKIDE